MTTFGPYPATVVSIHDGDTMTLLLDLGFNIGFKSNCRIYGINAPELSTEAGKEALAYAQTLVAPGDKVSVLSHGWDKYGGRFDGSVALADGSDFGTRMVATGHAVVESYATREPQPQEGATHGRQAEQGHTG